jgi:hypothetical protein
MIFPAAPRKLIHQIGIILEAVDFSVVIRILSVLTFLSLIVMLT